MLFSISDLAKYPFIKEARDYIKRLDLKINEVINSEYRELLNRVEQRIEEAILFGVIHSREKPRYEIEILSYPVAIMVVSTINDSLLDRRYALAEGRKVYQLLKKEDQSKMIDIGQSSFYWNAKKLSIGLNQPYDYSLNFVDYLRNTSRFREDKWKLVNRLMINGQVYLKKDEFARLISEEVRKHVFNTIKSSPKISLHPLIHQQVESLNQILREHKEKIRIEGLPKKILTAAYPPCIKRLYDALLAGTHLSHIGRFSLTAFLLNIGMDTEELAKIYISMSDFTERFTRYQIEHIAGKKGSGTKYLPPNCDSFKTHGLCPGPDKICLSIKHPLSYYRKKIKLIRRGNNVPKNR